MTGNVTFWTHNLLIAYLNKLLRVVTDCKSTDFSPFVILTFVGILESV